MIPFTNFKLGAGRYFHEPDILTKSGDNILHYGKKAYVIGGPKALQAAWPEMKKSFKASGLAYVKETYSGFTSDSKIQELLNAVHANGCDVIVGVGGGKILDLVKAVGLGNGIPVIAIPTSSATCAACTPLSMIYTDQGAAVRADRYDEEVSLVLADDNILARQPSRLLASGILDSMAKYIEIANGNPDIKLETDDIGRYSAFALAGILYDLLIKYGPQAYKDVSEKRPTKIVHDVTFTSIALTGVVTGLMRSYNQTAIAHSLYGAIRTYYFQESADYLHGEIVAAGLIAQLKFNHNEVHIPQLIDYMKNMHMPLTLQAIGIGCTPENIRVLTDAIYNTRFVPHTKEGRLNLETALKEIY